MIIIKDGPTANKRPPGYIEKENDKITLSKTSQTHTIDYNIRNDGNSVGKYHLYIFFEIVRIKGIYAYFAFTFILTFSNDHQDLISYSLYITFTMTSYVRYQLKFRIESDLKLSQNLQNLIFIFDYERTA